MTKITKFDNGVSVIVDTGSAFNDVKTNNVEISWPSFGAVSIDDATKFAASLALAIALAKSKSDDK